MISTNTPRVPQAGEIVDHYRLLSLVASSGMASVFRAMDVETGQLFAVKFSNLRKSRKSFLNNLFGNELKISLKLNHPRLVKMLPEANAHSGYIVMEWVEGKSLRRILDEQAKLPVDRAIRIAVSLCEALEYVHGHHIVHGDLKPENVLVELSDQIRLLDFGIAQYSKWNRWKRWTPAHASGTPGYVSPECIVGKSGDAKSDIYSLGITLFEMLTGWVPFSGVDPSVAMQMRTQFELPLASDIDSQILPRIDVIISRATALNRYERYP